MKTSLPRNKSRACLLKIQTLGGFEVMIGSDPMAGTRTKKERQLLALLAMRVGKPVSRDRLACSLWPESTQSQGLANLRRSLANLRRALGVASQCLSSGAGPVVLGPESVYVDAQEFDRLLQRGQMKDLREAISLYGGPFLPEFSEEWAASERLQRATSCARAIRTLVPQLTTPETTQYLNLAVALDPLNEEALRQLMSNLARCGDSGRALDIFRTQEQKVRTEYGWTLSPETIAAFDRIRADSVLPRKRQASSEDRIFGRSEEITQIKTMLRSGQFVSIVGPVGVGKSRLARAIVDQIGHEFADGFLRINFDSEKIDRDIFDLFCDQLSIEGTTDPGERVGEFLARKDLLVWIEGVELLPPLLRPVLEKLARHSPRALFLITSWQPLELAGEQVCVLEPLSVVSDEVEGSVGSDSAQLFAQRARVVWPGFSLSPTVRPLVERLCKLLEGLPLTIELAAAWSNTLSLEDIYEMFRGSSGQKLVLAESLTTSGRSLGSAIDLVIGTLNLPELDLLCAVSSFLDGCTLHALRSVSDLPASDLALALRKVVSRSLVSFDPTSKRYRLLRAVRERCLIRLSAVDRQRLLDTAGNYLWQLLENGLANGDTLFDNYADDWLLAERENFRFFLEHWSGRDHYRSLITEFAMVVYQVWQAPDVVLWMERFPSGYPFPGASEPFVRYVIAIFSMWQGHPDCEVLLEASVARCATAGAALWEAASWSGLSAMTEYSGNNLGQARLEQCVQNALAPLKLGYYPEHSKAIQSCREWMGGITEGADKLRAQLAQGTSQVDWRKRYASLRGLGGFALASGDYVSLSVWGRELAILAEQHAKHELTNILRWQAKAAIGCGDYASAREFAERAVSVARQRQTRDREGTARMMLAEVAERCGDWSEADRQLTLAGHVFESVRLHRALCECLTRRALIALDHGNRDDCTRLAVWAKSLLATQNFVLTDHYKVALEGLL